MSLSLSVRMFRGAVVPCAAFACLAAPLDAQPGNAQMEPARRIVVMVDATFADGPEDATNVGAGVVVGASMGRIYIATANHVVRMGDRVAGTVRVKFRGLPAEEFTARVLTLHDPVLDYALLMVNDRQADAVVSGLPFRILRSAPLAAGVPVVHVGQPNGGEWRTNVTPAAVSRVSGSTLLFQSSNLSPGYSGGGLFDSDGALVGLVTQDAGTDARAVRIDHLVAALQDEGIQVNLAAAGGASTGSGTGASIPADRQGRVGELTMEMTACTRSGTQLHCQMYLTAATSGLVGIGNASQGIDENGNTYRPTELRIANQSHRYTLSVTLAAGVRTPASLIFENVAPSRELPLVQVFTRFESRDWRHVAFRHVPISSR